MKRHLLLLALSLLIIGGTQAQSAKPKLVVGIVVDQMRNDYLYRFRDHFEDGGFNRLLEDGYQFKNAHYNYVPTYTGPGHASIYTGTTPRFHGIISNQWYDRYQRRMIYCSEDRSVTAVGGSGQNGSMSPANLLSSTVSDQLRLTSNFRSKVIGLAIKDRGGILPAGHSANAAYWYDPASGEFITSTYYMEKLPRWVNQFNKRKLPAEYLETTWETLKPIEEYVESATDDNASEIPVGTKTSPTFPYNLAEIATKENDFGLIRGTPFGNTLTLELALAAIDGEELGADEFTDLLAVSFSSTDYVGHAFGPHSKEIQDTYVRLDRDLARLFDALDSKVGAGEYVVFLTADHGVVHVPSYLQSVKVRGGYYSMDSVRVKLSSALGFGMGFDWVQNLSNDQIYLDYEVMAAREMDPEDVQERVAAKMLEVDGIFETFTREQITENLIAGDIGEALRNGFNLKRSGDVLNVLSPNTLSSNYGTRGTTHGSGFTYDTHVPILFYGTGIPSGSTVRRVNITDIAPSLSMLLDISLPNASNGEPLIEIFE